MNSNASVDTFCLRLSDDLHTRLAALKPPVQLTEKLLISAAGWMVILRARAMREAGRVAGAQWSPPLLQGSVREGEREYRAGLRILSQTNIDNLCTCRSSREYGTICAHSVAVGLAVVAGMSPPPAPKPAAGSQASPPPALPYRADPFAATRLHVVLAPDLASAWSKGQLLFGLESSENGRRTMFGAGGGRSLLPEDLRVVETLAALIRSVPGGVVSLDRTAFLQMLEALTGHGRVTLGRATPLEISDRPLKPTLQAKSLPDRSVEIAVHWPEGGRALVAGGRAWLLRLQQGGASLQPVAPGLPVPYLPLLEEASRRLPPDQADAFMDEEWPRLEAFFDLQADERPAARRTIEDPEPAPPQFLLTMEGSLNQLGAQLQANYGQGSCQHATTEAERMMVGRGIHGQLERVIRTRNVGAERAAIARLKGSGFAGPDRTRTYFLRGEASVLRFIARELPALQADPGWRVALGTRFANVTRNWKITTPEAGSSSVLAADTTALLSLPLTPGCQLPAATHEMTAPATVPLDLNAATEEAIAALPGVGIAMAKRIVAARQQEGRFTSLETLAEQLQIRPHIVERIRPLIRLPMLTPPASTKTPPRGRIVDY